MSQPVQYLETTGGEPAPIRWARYALIVGAMILVWLALAGATLIAVEGRELFDDDPATPALPAPAADELVRDLDGRLCPAADLSSDGYCIG